MIMRKLTRQVSMSYTDPVVETRAGRLRGACVEGTYIFRGVQYAQARRFHMPEPVKSRLPGNQYRHCRRRAICAPFLFPAE